MTIDLPNPEATRTFGLRLAERLFPGTVLALIGELGAGKTSLSRAIAEGLGVTDERVVTSPTFVLLQEYQGRLPVYHFDAYRLKSEGDFGDLGVEEYFEGDGVCLIEWADRVPGFLPRDHLRITLTVTGETSRRATVEATGPRHVPVIDSLRKGREGSS